MDMGPAGTGRLVLSLAAMVLIAVGVWFTLDPGKMQQVVFLLLGFFTLRILLGWMRSRRIESGAASDSQSREG